jgi:sugar phosphate isomerase/epimerase
VIELGIFAKTFPRPTLGESLDAVEATGLRAIQFNLGLTGGPSLPDAAIPAEEIRAAVAARGLAMAAVSGTYNMAHPSAAVRDDGRRRLAALIAAAPGLGTRVVTLCTGTRDPDDMWRAHPDNATPEAWRDSVDSLTAALEVAERHGVVLGIEPEHANVAVDARAARALLDELRSPNLKIVIDAANLVSDVDRQDDTLREAFELLGDDLVLAHAKDVTADGTIVAAGHGGLDYPLYIHLLRTAGYDGPLVMHGLAEEQVAASAHHLAQLLA